LTEKDRQLHADDYKAYLRALRFTVPKDSGGEGRSFEQCRSDLSDVGSFHTSLGITRGVDPSPAGSKDAGRTVLKCSRIEPGGRGRGVMEDKAGVPVTPTDRVARERSRLRRRHRVRRQAYRVLAPLLGDR
jgi:hypothetical protein